MRRPSRRQIVALAVLGLVAALAFSEIYLRLFGSRLFGDRGRSYVHRPYMLSRVGGVPFRTNGWGLRGEDFHGTALRAVALGGSATEAADLPEEETWPVRAEAQINARYRLRVIPGAARSDLIEIANAGSAGLSSAHYVAHFAELAKPLGLAVVIVYSGLNDADRLARQGRLLRVDAIGDRSYREAMLQAFNAPDPARLAEGAPLLERSRLWLFARSFVEKSLLQPARNRFEDLVPGRRLRDKRARLRASPDLPRILERAKADYTHNLELIADSARAQGVTPIFMAPPPIGKEPELEALNAALIDFCERRGAVLLDLTALAAPARGWYTPGSHHFTPEASDLVGARIADTIDALLDGRLAGGIDLARHLR